MKNENIDKLIAELEKVVRFYRSSNADFCWSRYASANEAVDEMNGIILALKDGNPYDITNQLALLFAPTGDVGEIASNSGWVNEYLLIAEKVDHAIADLRAVHE